MREATLDFVQLLIGGYRLDGRQIPLLGLNDVFAFQRLLPHQVDGMLKKTKLPLTQLPGKITMTMMAAQTRSGRSPDLVRHRRPHFPWQTCARRDCLDATDPLHIRYGMGRKAAWTRARERRLRLALGAEDGSASAAQFRFPGRDLESVLWNLCRSHSAGSGR